MTTIGTGYDDNNLRLFPNGDGTVTVEGDAPVTLPIKTLIEELTSFLAESEVAKGKSHPDPQFHQGRYSPLAR